MPCCHGQGLQIDIVSALTCCACLQSKTAWIAQLGGPILTPTYDLFLSKLKHVEGIMKLKHPDRMLTCCATQACAYLLSTAATVLHPAAAAPAPSSASDLAPLVATAEDVGPALGTAAAAVDTSAASVDVAAPASADAAPTKKPDVLHPICQSAEVGGNKGLLAEQVFGSCLLPPALTVATQPQQGSSCCFTPTPLTFMSTKQLRTALCSAYCCILQPACMPTRT